MSALLDRSGARRPGPAALWVDELDELVRLYRRATSDLAIARRDYPGDPVTVVLNQLVARGYGIVYRDPPAALSRLGRFYAHELPREYRAAWPFLVAAAAMFFVPLVVSALAVALSPEAARLILPSAMLDEISRGQTWFDSSLAERPYLASFIMTNNLQVALLALAGGLLGGVLTAAVLIDNGIFIGGVIGALVAHGLTDRLVGFVSPHGFLELSVVVVAGASGLMLGKAVVWPGLPTRRSALVTAGQRSIRLLLGMLPVLGLAGLLEGFVSPSTFPWPFKLAIGLTTAVLLYGYLLIAGKSFE